MKEVLQMFDESFATMAASLKDEKYSNCMRLSTDMITLSVLSDYKDGIMIGEVLEAVFDQIGLHTLEDFEVTTEERISIKDRLAEYIMLLSQSYRNGNSNEIYDALREIRSAATSFQYKCLWTAKLKESESRPYMIGRGRP